MQSDYEDVKDQNSDLSEQVKQLKKFEFLYDQEKFSKKEFSNENMLAQEKLDRISEELKSALSKVGKKDKEIQKLNAEVDQLKKREGMQTSQIKGLKDLEDDLRNKLEDLRNENLELRQNVNPKQLSEIQHFNIVKVN